MLEEKYITINEASVLIGVTTTTLRRWDKNGSFSHNHRTVGNHRRYKLIDVINFINPERINEDKRKVVCYARVSSHDQKKDLERQSIVLKNHCFLNEFNDVEFINDLGSGLNFKKKGLKKLLNMILNNEVDKLILTHKDRLLRFGSDLIINIAKHYNTETIILNHKDKSFEEELSQDVLEIITVFSARLYGSRSHKNKKLIKT